MTDIPDEAVEAACFAMHGPEWEERDDGFHVPSMRAALAAALPYLLAGLGLQVTITHHGPERVETTDGPYRTFTRGLDGPPPTVEWHCGRHGLPLGECDVCHGPCDGGMVCVVCTNKGSE